MNYTTAAYQQEFHPRKSVRTVRRMIKSGLVPSNHLAYKIGRDYIVEVRNEEEYAQTYCTAILDFHKHKGEKSCQLELAAEIAVKYTLHLGKLVKLLGI